MSSRRALLTVLFNLLMEKLFQKNFLFGRRTNQRARWLIDVSAISFCCLGRDEKSTESLRLGLYIRM